MIAYSLGFGVTVTYECDISENSGLITYHDTLFSRVTTIRVTIDLNGGVALEVWDGSEWEFLPGEKDFPLPYIVGYSSGLNENLQRSFMKNSVQYFDAINAKSNLSKLLEVKKMRGVNEDELYKTEQWYQSRHKEIFDIEAVSSGSDNDFTRYTLKNIKKPHSLYLDYDCTSLVVASLSVLTAEERNRFLGEIKYRHPSAITMTYSMKGEVLDDNDVYNVKKLIQASSNFSPRSEKDLRADDDDFNGLEYISGDIEFDLTNDNVWNSLSELNYHSPAQLFDRLYGLQLLGVKSWQEKDKKNLRNDEFQNNVKKPLKTKLPLEITQLKLADDSGNSVDFDDLSDGEAQLIQVLAATRTLDGQNALYLFDEPETHLNPSWRTYFHSYLCRALEETEGREQQAQVFLSTHSPFMLSSLKKEDVFFFRRDENAGIQMDPIGKQTYGASFDVLIKDHFGLRSLISQTVIEKIREKLGEGDEHARQWIKENLGMSPEKTYLLKILSQ